MEGRDLEPEPEGAIYSPPRLASFRHPSKIYKWRDGIEPSTHWSFNPLLYQLSYWFLLREQDEPTTFGLWARRATELLHPVNTKGGCGIWTHARFYTPDGFRQDRSLQLDLGTLHNSPYGIRTRVTAERRVPNPLTNGPNSMGHEWTSNHWLRHQACALTTWATRPS